MFCGTVTMTPLGFNLRDFISTLQNVFARLKVVKVYTSFEPSVYNQTSHVNFFVRKMSDLAAASTVYKAFASWSGSWNFSLMRSRSKAGPLPDSELKALIEYNSKDVSIEDVVYPLEYPLNVLSRSSSGTGAPVSTLASRGLFPYHQIRENVASATYLDPHKPKSDSILAMRRIVASHGVSVAQILEGLPVSKHHTHPWHVKHNPKFR